MKQLISRPSIVLFVLFLLNTFESDATEVQPELKIEPGTAGITIHDSLEGSTTKRYSHLLLTGPKLMFGFDLWNPLPETANWLRV